MATVTTSASTTFDAASYTSDRVYSGKRKITGTAAKAQLKRAMAARDKAKSTQKGPDRQRLPHTASLIVKLILA